MRKNPKILKGGIDNEINYSRFEKFIGDHIRLKIGIPMTEKETESTALRCYIWVQERKHKNAPVITENDVWSWACEDYEVAESF